MSDHMGPINRRYAVALLAAGANLAVPAASAAGAGRTPSVASPDTKMLWYAHPAASWVEALPVGNGRIGAMVHGGTDREYIQLK